LVKELFENNYLISTNNFYIILCSNSSKNSIAFEIQFGEEISNFAFQDILNDNLRNKFSNPQNIKFGAIRARNPNCYEANLGIGKRK
jgi:hypothetical protein